MKIKEIPGLEGRYKITDTGEIFSIRNNKFIKTQEIKGYKSIVLRVNGEKKRLMINRLVYMTYYGPIEKGQQVGHLDGNRINNHYSNLRAMSHLCNEAFKIDHGTLLTGEQCHLAKVTKENVLSIIKLRKSGLQFKDIAKKFPINLQTISRICSGLCWSKITGIEYKRNRKNLLKEQKDEIFYLYTMGISIKKLCEDFGRARSSITSIINKYKTIENQQINKGVNG